MKRFCFVLGVLVLLVFTIGSVLAEEIWVINDEGLVPYQREENQPIYPIPPKRLSAEIAGKLIRGEISKHVIKEDAEIKWTLKPFWGLRKITTIPKTEVSYSASTWISKEILPQKKEKTDWTGGLLFLTVPAIFVLLVSIANQNKRFGDKKLFAFYGAIFILIIFSALFGSVVGKIIGLLVGIFVGVFIGGFAGGFAAGRFDGEVAGAAVGFFVGVFAGMFANNFAIVKAYLIFIASICILSFITAKVNKRLRPVKKASII